MKHTSPENIEYLRIAIEKNQLPRYVYKYREIGEFTDKIFTDLELWFSKPKAFNDPFDCQIETKHKNSDEEILEYYRKETNLPFNDKNFDTKAWKKIVDKVISGYVNNCGILCFAGQNDNMLMWSHYTNSHKGICLKFDMLQDLEFFMLPMVVKYSNDYPSYNHLKEKEKILEKLFQTKSLDWKYENEIRILKPEKSGSFKFNKKALVEICFGANVEKSERARLKKIIRQNALKIKFKQAKVSKNEFKLIIEDL